MGRGCIPSQVSATPHRDVLERPSIVAANRRVIAPYDYTYDYIFGGVLDEHFRSPLDAPLWHVGQPPPLTYSAAATIARLKAQRNARQAAAS